MSTPPRDTALGPVAILGMGLMGGSLGLALRAAEAASEVVAWNRSPAGALRAVECGAADRAEARAVDAVRRADIVVIATPVDTVIPLLREIAPALRPGAVVTDVGSTKRRIVEEASAVPGVAFVGGHPMAGSEECGLAASSEALYRGATWAITPAPGASEPATATVERLARAAGAFPLICGAAEHDEWVAALSHIPHIVAYGLAAAARETVADGAARMAAGSFRDGTRVAESDAELWTGIVMDNRHAVLEGLERYQRWMDRVRSAVERGDAGELREAFSAARDARRWFRHERQAADPTR